MEGTTDVTQERPLLSADEHRNLAAIEHQLHAEDPHFAAALRAGVPRRPNRDNRGPVLVLITLACVAFALATLAGQPDLMGLTVVALVAALGAYRAQVRRSHHWRPGTRWKPLWW